MRFWLLALALAGCTAPPPVAIPDASAGADLAMGCPPGPATGDLPCDVGAVLQAKCQPCHTIPRMNGAPFPLRSYEDTQQPLGTTGLLRWQRMAQVIEPNNFPHMPPIGYPQLSDADFATLRGWFAACAQPVPEGTGCDVGEVVPDGGTD